MNINMMRKWVMAGGLAMTLFTGATTAQVIGGEVEIDGSGNDVVFLGGEMNVQGLVNGDIKGIAGSILVDADVRGSVQLVGGEIDVMGTISDDLDVAGGEVDVDAAITGDANFAGGDSQIRGTIGGTLHAAAGHVEMDAQVAGEAKLAGGYVETSSSSQIAGATEVVGGEVHLQGRINGPVNIEGGEIHLSGTFLDDVEILAEEVYVLDGTQISGELRIRSPQEPMIADDASMGSYDYAYEAFNFGAKDWEHVDLDFDFDPPMGVFSLFIPGAAFLLAAFACLIAPNGTASVAGRFRDSPVVSGFLGFISFALSPIFLLIMTILLAITVVGILLIPIMWLIFWPFMLLCMGFGAIAIGDMVFNRQPQEKTLGLGMRLLSTFAVIAVFAALGALPVVGILAGFVLLFVGLGAWLMSLGKRQRPAAPVIEGTASV